MFCLPYIFVSEIMTNYRILQLVNIALDPSDSGTSYSFIRFMNNDRYSSARRKPIAKGG